MSCTTIPKPTALFLTRDATIDHPSKNFFLSLVVDISLSQAFVDNKNVTFNYTQSAPKVVVITCLKTSRHETII